MGRKWWLLICIIIGCSSVNAQQAAKSFPQHVHYAAKTIRPDNYSQIELDRQVSDFYTQWKKRYVRTVTGAHQSFIWFGATGGKQCVSEGQGYGMEIVALMAGFDPSAQNTFDDLYRYYKAHPSNRGGHLMAWAQDNKGRDLDKTSASDGDIDIAYALLLAGKQWGSKGNVDYLAAAKQIIADIMQYEINLKTWSVLLSNAVEDDSKDYFDTRSSDFMPANFRAFYNVTNDVRWQQVIDKNYRLFSYMQSEYSPDAGLVPDFIIDINKKPQPAAKNYLESPYDGMYNYNACRVPWRIGVDYLLNGDGHAKAIVDKMNRWVRETTDDKADNLSAGYTLGGDDIKGRYFEALSFIAPFAVSASADKKNQQWLNSVWSYTIGFKLKDFDYYDNTIKLLDMIIVSGNYWRVDFSSK